MSCGPPRISSRVGLNTYHATQLDDAITQIHQRLKYLEDNAGVTEVTQLRQEVRNLNDALSETNARIDQLQSTITSINSQLKDLERVMRQVSDLSTRMRNVESISTENQYNISTLDQRVSTNATALANAQPNLNSLENMKTICRHLVTNQWMVKWQRLGTTDGNGFLRFSFTGSDIGINDRIISLVPFDLRTSDYRAIVIGWTDYQNDGTINIQVKWCDSSSTWSNAGNVNVYAYYVKQAPYYNLPV